MLVLTSNCTFDSGSRAGTDATLVVNNLRDFSAIRHVRVVCKGMADAGDIGLVGAIALCVMVACLPSAIAAYYEALGRFG